MILGSQHASGSLCSISDNGGCWAFCVTGVALGGLDGSAQNGTTLSENVGTDTAYWYCSHWIWTRQGRGLPYGLLDAQAFKKVTVPFPVHLNFPLILTQLFSLVLLRRRRVGAEFPGPVGSKNTRFGATGAARRSLERFGSSKDRRQHL